MAIMYHTKKATITETVDTFARLMGCSAAETEACIDELKQTRTADVTLRNGRVTLKSRKYARELRAKELSNLRVAKHRGNANVTLVKHDIVKSNKKEVKSKEKEEEREEAAIAAAHSPAVAVYESIFGKAKPAFAKQIEKRVTNLALWQKLLSDKSSFDNVAGWILTAYDERVADLTPQNGRLRAGAHDAIEVFPDPNAVRKCAKCGSEYCLGGKQCEMRANGASEGEIKAAVDQATAEMLGTR